uniref:LIM domain kinase 1 (Trinotate prediction) n=1 Tax=Myxobolus squamalis TaxID=59785 RepID=A0A6B2G0A3_MYXSQ
MLNGKQYKLSVDNFSFGIVICELLARTNAHPDNIPRLNNFGLDEQKFRQKIVGIPNPQYLINVAVNCCNLDPEKRSSFSSIKKLIQIKMNEDSKTICSSLVSPKLLSHSERI